MLIAVVLGRKDYRIVERSIGEKIDTANVTRLPRFDSHSHLTDELPVANAKFDRYEE